MGLIESLRFASHIPSIKEKISLNYEQYYEKIIHLISDDNYKLGIPLPIHSSGFMTGMSGIICAFIKYFEPNSMPNILI